MIEKEELKKGLRITIISLIMFVIILVSVNYVSAYKQLCLGYGDSVPSAENPRFTCRHDTCQICVTDNLYPSHPGKCKSMSGCSSSGNSSIDQVPPELTIKSPSDNQVFDSRKVLFDIKSNEPASIYYIDNINGRGRWKKIASLVMSYFRDISFKDGLNDITIKAVDRKGNEAEVVRQFYVDSKKPKIRKTYPKKGFANGDFEVEFVEENPKNLILHYGNGVFGEKELNIEDCNNERGKYSCITQINLGSFNMQNFEYWFELTDIAGNTYESKHISLSVDTTPPVINNPDNFWIQGEDKKNKYIYFNIDITDDNFDEVVYSYDDGKKIRETRICSRLKEGICSAKKSFKKGHNILDIEIRDEAGNAVSKRIEFDVV